AQEAHQGELARLSAQVMTMFELVDDLKLTEVIELDAVRHKGQIEQAGPRCPVSLVPLKGGPIGEAPGIGGIVERCSVDQRPVDEIVAGIVGIRDGVEEVRNAEFSDGDDQPVGGL